MYIELTIIGLYILSTVVITAIAIWLYYHYQRKNSQAIKDKIDQTTSREIQIANNRVKEIIESALEKARQVLLETEDVKQTAAKTKELQAVLSQIEGNTAALLEQKGGVVDQQYQELLNTLKKEAEMAAAALSDIQSLRENLVSEIENKLKVVGEQAVVLLAKESAQFDQEYKTMITTIKQDYVKKADETLKIIEKIPEQELTDFSNILKKETVEAQSVIDKRVQEQFEKSQQEIQKYKEEKLKEVDRSINKIIIQVAGEVIGKTLSLSEHEKLVFDALESAKREGFFNK